MLNSEIPFPVEDIKAYLTTRVRSFSRLPWYYPSHLDIKSVCQQVRVRKYISQPELQNQRITTNGSMYFPLYDERDDFHQLWLEQSDMWRGEFDKYETEEEEFQSILDWGHIRKRMKRGVILGRPGSGKTWLLQYEAYRVALEQLETLKKDPKNSNNIILPFYIHLVALSNELTAKDQSMNDAIISIIQHHYGVSDEFVLWIRSQLFSKHCLFLFDAFDEVPQEKPVCSGVGIRTNRRFPGGACVAEDIASRTCVYPMCGDMGIGTAR
jgi:hypothetical protein